MKTIISTSELRETFKRRYDYNVSYNMILKIIAACPDVRTEVTSEGLLHHINGGINDLLSIRVLDMVLKGNEYKLDKLNNEHTTHETDATVLIEGSEVQRLDDVLLKDYIGLVHDVQIVFYRDKDRKLTFVTMFSDIKLESNVCKEITVKPYF